MNFYLLRCWTLMFWSLYWRSLLFLIADLYLFVSFKFFVSLQGQIGSVWSEETFVKHDWILFYVRFYLYRCHNHVVLSFQNRSSTALRSPSTPTYDNKQHPCLEEQQPLQSFFWKILTLRTGTVQLVCFILAENEWAICLESFCKESGLHP